MPSFRVTCHSGAAFYYGKPYNDIHQIEVNEKTFSFRTFNKELMCLPKSALGAMIMLHEKILCDLEDEKKPVKKYWSDEDITIYTKEVTKLVVPTYIETVDRKLLCILKAPVEVVVDAKMLQALVLRAVILNRIQGDDCIVSRVGPEYKLNSTKSIIFHNDGTFSIFDEVSPNQFQLLLKGLINLIMKRNEILADLDSQNSSDENIYYEEDSLTLKTMPSKNSRIFSFWVEGIAENDPYRWVEEEMSLNKDTLDLMLHVALGASMWKDGMKEDEKIKEPRMLYWDNTPFNIVKRIEFSADLQKFTITNDSYGVRLTLPTAALKAALDRKIQILADLESETSFPSSDKDYINEYWTNQTYAIRTDVIYNLFREIDCKVVKFTKVKDSGCPFVVHKQAFLKLLESYQHRRRNSKKR